MIFVSLVQPGLKWHLPDREDLVDVGHCRLQHVELDVVCVGWWRLIHRQVEEVIVGIASIREFNADVDAVAAF